MGIYRATSDRASHRRRRDFARLSVSRFGRAEGARRKLPRSACRGARDRDICCRGEPKVLGRDYLWRYDPANRVHLEFGRLPICAQSIVAGTLPRQDATIIARVRKRFQAASVGVAQVASIEPSKGMSLATARIRGRTWRALHFTSGLSLERCGIETLLDLLGR